MKKFTEKHEFFVSVKFANALLNGDKSGLSHNEIVKMYEWVNKKLKKICDCDDIYLHHNFNIDEEYDIYENKISNKIESYCQISDEFGEVKVINLVVHFNKKISEKIRKIS